MERDGYGYVCAEDGCESFGGSSSIKLICVAHLHTLHYVMFEPDQHIASVVYAVIALLAD